VKDEEISLSFGLVILPEEVDAWVTDNSYDWEPDCPGDCCAHYLRAYSQDGFLYNERTGHSRYDDEDESTNWSLTEIVGIVVCLS